MKYQQLTEGLRYQIACLRDHGLSQARIAKQLGVHPSTISRELRRNCAGQAYQPQQAHQLATARRLTSQKRTVPSDTIDFVCMALVADWSPEQISGVGDMINCPVSHEWIYRYLITHDPQPASRADMASEGLPRLHAPIQQTYS